MAIERREAAEFLGVSVSTLDRLASQGRLTRGRARRKTRPVTTFDESELKALKAELEIAKPSDVLKQRPTEKTPDTIGFRLDAYYVARLKAEGEARGMSAGEFARSLVIQSLENGREEKFANEVRLLREGLAHTFYTLLVMKFGVSEEEAREFVNTTIGRK